MTRIGLASTLATALAFGALIVASPPARAQVTATELLMRIDQLEGQVRQLTGAVEQLQFRNQQLETSLRKMQEESEFRFQELGGKGQGGQGRPSSAARPSAPSQPAPIAQQPAPPSEPAYLPPPAQRQGYESPRQQGYATSPPPSPQQGYSPSPSQGYAPPAPQQPAYTPPSPSPSPAGRRSDAFDPSQNPNAPGAPRPLGSIYASGGGPGDAGAPQGRGNAPLDLSGRPVGGGDPGYGAAGGGSGLPPPPPRNPNATGAQVATLPPSQSPKDEYDLATGYLQRKDYELAEQSFREFLRKYPSDALAGDAQYGVGESLYRRQSYREAADAFLTLTKAYARSPRAPDALLRLGQSLAALKEKDLACGAFAEIGRKYPRVSPTVKQTVEREQKRVGC